MSASLHVAFCKIISESAESDDDNIQSLVDVYQMLDEDDNVSEEEDFHPFQSRDQLLLYLLVHCSRKFVSCIIYEFVFRHSCSKYALCFLCASG